MIASKTKNRSERARQWLERQGARLSRRLPRPPFQSALARLEREVANSLLALHAVEIAKARRECLPRRRAGAAARPGTEAAEALADRMVTELRERMECVPWDRPLLGAVARLDQRLPTSRGEHMDDPKLSPAVRSELVRVLDVQTRRAGDYVVLADLVEPLYPADPAAVVSLLDVASGPGGFAIAAALASEGKRCLRIVASDVDADYLEIGRARARAAGVLDTIEFRPIDAFALGEELAGWQPDIVTCTRSLHHFGVRGTLRLLAVALQTAARGVLFVDIARSISRMVMAAGAGLASGNWQFAHDAVVSVQKSFTAEELRLLAACIPGGETLDIFYVSPAYVVVRSSVAERAARTKPGRAHAAR